MVLLAKLPNEILLEIFEYCKVQPLMLVCKQFKEMIMKAPQLMKKVNLIISEKSTLSEFVKSERNFQSVFFKFHYKINDRCIEVCEKFSGIKSIEFVRCIVSVEAFMKILKSLPQLEAISIYSTYLKGKDDSWDEMWRESKDFEPPQLDKLKSCNFRNSDAGFLRFLQRAQIRNFSALLQVQNSPRDLVKFLQTQPRIEIIESLSVSGVDDTLFKVLLQELSCLRKLHLECDRLNMSSIRDLELKNKSIRYLNLCGFPDHDNDRNADYIKILSFFKGLKALEIEMNSYLEPVIVGQLLVAFPQLESLVITDCTGDYFNNIQMPAIKCLKLTDGSQSAEDWTRFAHRNPSIESLVIKDESITNEVFTTICTEFSKLQYLEVNFDPQRLTPEILDFVCDQSFPRNIRNLKVIQRASPRERFLILTENQIRALDKNPGFKCVFN